MNWKVLIALVALVVMAVFGTAQTHAKSMTANKLGMKMAAMYACPKCEMASMKGGKCPGCKAEMIKISGKMVGMCPKCHAVGKKGDTCAHCKAKMVAAVETYTCDACHTSSKVAGKCKKCGMAMKKHDLPMMGKS